jgi:hypothetical protein
MVTARETTARPAPVVVWTYALSGAELLIPMLSASGTLACTSATGLLPLCHEAIGTWQQVEGRDGPPSQLAITSVRTLATSMITVIQACTGATRWCETAFASTEVARTFLQVFPATKILCLHRSLRGVFGEAARSYPWGLGGSPLWPFAVGHPGNNAATIASYWANRTQDLLDFEAAYPGSSLRVRYEDLADDPDQQANEILAALGLDQGERTVWSEPSLPEASPEVITAPDPGLRIPADRIPPPLLAIIHDLHATLAYDFTA